MEDLSRRGAYWSKHEERMLLECYTNGMSIYDMANKFDRTQNAINMRLDIIKPIQNYTYIPSYIPTYVAPQIEDMPIQREKTTAQLDGEFILSMREKGMRDEDIKKIMFAKPSCVTTTKNDCCIA